MTAASWMLVAGTGLTLALPLAARIRARRFDPFEPYVLFALAYAVMFVLRPAAILADGPTGFWGIDFSDRLPVALLLAQLGAVAFVCAHELPLGRAVGARVPAPPRLDDRALTAAALVVAAAAVVSFLILLPLSDPGESLRIVVGGRGDPLKQILSESSTYLWYASWALAPAALVLVGVAIRTRRAVSWGLATLVIALALVRTVPIGSRLVLLPLLGGILVLAYVMKGRRPSAGLLVGLVVGALVLSYAMPFVRDPDQRANLSDEALRALEHPHVLLHPLTEGDDAEMVAALSTALTVVPDELGYRYGEATIGGLLTRPVPREWWRGKPRPAREEIIEHIWPELPINPAFSPLLSFYWDFWLAGVAVGMGLFGIGVRALHAWFLGNRTRFGAQLVFSATVWCTVIAARNDVVDTAVFALFLVVPAIIAVAASGVDGRLATLLRPGREQRVTIDDRVRDSALR